MSGPPDRPRPVDDAVKGESEPLDKARAVAPADPPARKTHPASTRQIAAGQRLLSAAVEGRKVTMRQVLVESGYADETAKQPKANGLTPAKLIGAALSVPGAIETAPDATPGTALRVGLETLLGLATNDDEPGSTRGAAAKALLDHAEKAGVTASDVPRPDLIAVRRWSRRGLARAIRNALRVAEREGFEAAYAAVGRADERTDLRFPRRPARFVEAPRWRAGGDL